MENDAFAICGYTEYVMAYQKPLVVSCDALQKSPGFLKKSVRATGPSGAVATC